MSFKKKIVLALLFLFAVLLNVFILTHGSGLSDTVEVRMTLSGDAADAVQLYYGNSPQFLPANQVTVEYQGGNKEQEMVFAVPSDATYLRIDLGSQRASFRISGAKYLYKNSTEPVLLSAFEGGAAEEMNNITSSQISGDTLLVETEAGDPFITAKTGPYALAEEIAAEKGRNNLIKNIFYAAVADLAFLVLFIFRKRFSTLPTELIQNRKLILQLAKNDFKTKYAGSVFGIIWAFIQPTVTVVVYWFVFQVGLGAGDVTSKTGLTYPFVLWLISGLVPWFFFQDVLIGGTNALLEYTYLVKKVVFKISILPIVKEISALFVHLFFIALMLLLYAFGGFLPDVKVLQVLYYSFCLFMYGLGVCYATCSIVVFFRDLTQIISIIIQIQVWMTPIMWNIDTLGARMPSWLITIFKLNPMYYIVHGYRDAMINKVWFWERFDLTFYFWAVTGVFFVLGAYVFKRLKVHFADTL